MALMGDEGAPSHRARWRLRFDGALALFAELLEPLYLAADEVVRERIEKECAMGFQNESIMRANEPRRGSCTAKTRSGHGQGTNFAQIVSRLNLTPEHDLAADHNDAGVPVMGVIGVHVICFQPPIEDLVTLTPKVGLKIALVHGGLQLRVPRIQPRH